MKSMTVSNLLGFRELALTGTPLPPGVCLPKSAKAGVKSGPRGKIRGSRVRIGNLGWLICMKKKSKAQHKLQSNQCHKDKNLDRKVLSAETVSKRWLLESVKILYDLW